MSESSKPDWFRIIVSAALPMIFLGYLGWLGLAHLKGSEKIDALNQRITRVEVTIIENKAEREAQVAELRTRMNRIEDRMETTRGREGGGE